MKARVKDRGLNENMVLLTTMALKNGVKIRCSIQLLTVGHNHACI